MLDGVVVLGNNAPSGGGAFVDGGSPFFQDCNFNNNNGTTGIAGGMNVTNGAVFFMVNCDFDNNGAANAGGMRIANNCFATLYNCDFTGNTANLAGGGLQIDNGSVVSLDSCDFFGNSTANSDGGGLAARDHSAVTLRNCEFNGNQAGRDGGGLYASDTSWVGIVNSEFYSNRAALNGGAINMQGARTEVTNGLFWGNRALSQGGGMYLNQRADAIMSNCCFSRDTAAQGGGIRTESLASAEVRNSILWGDMGMELSADSTANLTATYSTIMGGYPGVGNSPMGPMWVDEANNDLHLMPGSPAIDVGNNALLAPDTLDVDADGNFTEPTPPPGGGTRIVGLVADMWVFEQTAAGFCSVTAVCQNLSVTLDSNGIAVITASQVDNGSSSTCQIDSLWLSRDTLDCNDIPTATVELIVLDTSGTTDTCTAIISVSDGLPPSAVCKDITIYLDAAGAATITPADIDGGTTDNCGLGTMIAFPDAFGCAQIGTISVDLFVNDIHNNFSNCTALVTVEDSLPPTLDCPGDTILYLPNNTCDLALPDFTFVGTIPIANSSGDFSGVQGQSNWYFGHYPAFQSGSFTQLPNFSGSWTGSETGGTPALDNNGGSPGTVSLNWSVRRWISTYRGLVDISGGFFDRDGSCGDGVDIRIFKNGVQIFSASNITTASTPYNFSVAIQAGDTLDFAIDPRTTSDCDDTHFTSIITADSPLDVIDNCGVDTLFSTPEPGTLITTGITPVTIFGVDGTGTVDSCSFNVTVVDSHPPVAMCVPDSTPFYLDSTGAVTLIPADLNNGSFDNCAIDSMMISANSFGCSNLGLNSVTLTVWDPNGLSASCATNVWIQDSIVGGVVGCPADVVLTNTPGICGRMAGWFPPTAYDNCGVDSLIGSHTPATLFPGGTTEVTYIAYLTLGGTDTCSFNVIINDIEPPVISNCPSGIVTTNDPGVCEARITWTPPTVTDNCPSFTLTSNFNSPATLPVGTTIVTYVATDQWNNTDSCRFPVTINDVERPSITCPTNVTVGTDAGLCGAQVTYTPPVGTDNCSGATTVQAGGLGSGGTFPIGTFTETYIVSDGVGFTDTCSFSITVVDDDPPVFSNCPANISTANDAGQCAAVVSWITPGVSDNCGSVSLSSSHTPGSNFPVGVTTVDYVGIDGVGNADTCSFTVTVTDQEAPQITCPGNVNVSNDSGLCGAIFTYGVPIGSDNCSGVTTAQTGGIGSGALFPVGTTTESYQVTDASGFSASCSFTVTVVDTEPPVFLSCPLPVVTANDSGICGAVINWTPPSFSDNCGISSVTSTHVSGDTFDVGLTTVVYTVTDSANLTGTCSFSITITDDESPEINCPSNISVSNDLGACGATVMYPTPTATDNCPGVAVTQTLGQGSGTFFSVGTSTEVFTATDANGKTDVCSFLVTVTDGEAPSLSNCPADTTVSNAVGQCSAQVGWTAPTAIDNCAVTNLTPSQSPGSLFNAGTSTVTYIAEDAAGNADTCSFTVTVTDTEDPSISCPTAISVGNDAGLCGATVTYPDPTATDNCTGVTSQLLSGIGSGNLFPVGLTTETFIAVDGFGNTDTCSFTVTVSDLESPMLVGCPANMTKDNDPGQCSAVVTWSTVLANDNCGATLTASHSSGTSFLLGTTQVSFTATDSSGNMDSCSPSRSPLTIQKVRTSLVQPTLPSPIPPECAERL